jgi:hypothetical protein
MNFIVILKKICRAVVTGGFAASVLVPHGPDLRHVDVEIHRPIDTRALTYSVDSTTVIQGRVTPSSDLWFS